MDQEADRYVAEPRPPAHPLSVAHISVQKPDSATQLPELLAFRSPDPTEPLFLADLLCQWQQLDQRVRLLPTGIGSRSQAESSKDLLGHVIR